MPIAENIKRFHAELPVGVELVAVSKTWSNEDIMQAYHSGQRIFGENRVHELTQKYLQLPKDIEWHMIGNLQRNKVKYIAPFAALIHSVDSMPLLETIDKEAAKNKRVINCLLQIKIAKEDTKSGMLADEMRLLITSKEFAAMRHICIKGLMGMATQTKEEAIIRGEFLSLRNIFNEMKQLQIQNLTIETLSMGMSQDYKIAIEEGSNMLRIGRLIALLPI